MISEFRKIDTLPATDIQKFSEEILVRGAEAVMPQNLPDRWLRLISRDLREAQKAGFQGRHEEKAVNLAVPILIVAALLANKQASGRLSSKLTTKAVHDGIRKLEVAIVDEILGRETGVFLRKYTTDRIV